MGLASDLEQVLIDNLSDTGEESIELDSFVQKKTKQLAKGLSAAIVDWVQAQTFEVTVLQAPITIDDLSTPQPVVGTAAPPAATIPFALSRFGGNGGVLISGGNALINASPDESLLRQGEVQLIDVVNK